MFNPSVIHLIDGVDIDKTMNALTLIHDLHKLFGNFEIAFEPVDSQPHTYRIDYMDSDRMGRVESSQSPAIGRILYLSVVGEYIDEFIRDLEMESGEVMQNGTTHLDDYVRFKLGEMSLH
ncbi:hypothetical protein BDW67DRAFT_184102 [Aspergillus spinulosporus]